MVPNALSRICPNSDIEPNNITSIIVEPSFLQRISNAQFDATDKEIAAYIENAKILHPDFRIIRRNNVPLLVKTKGTV